MSARLIMLAVVMAVSVSAVSYDGLAAMPHWPPQLQGPIMHGLVPEIYAIWQFNEVGTDVCYENPGLVYQLPGCAAW